MCLACPHLQRCARSPTGPPCRSPPPRAQRHSGCPGSRQHGPPPRRRRGSLQGVERGGEARQAAVDGGSVRLQVPPPAAVALPLGVPPPYSLTGVSHRGAAAASSSHARPACAAQVSAGQAPKRLGHGAARGGRCAPQAACGGQAEWSGVGVGRPGDGRARPRCRALPATGPLTRILGLPAAGAGEDRGAVVRPEAAAAERRRQSGGVGGRRWHSVQCLPRLQASLPRQAALQRRRRSHAAAALARRLRPALGGAGAAHGVRGSGRGGRVRQRVKHTSWGSALVQEEGRRSLSTAPPPLS